MSRPPIGAVRLAMFGGFVALMSLAAPAQPAAALEWSWEGYGARRLEGSGSSGAQSEPISFMGSHATFSLQTFQVPAPDHAVFVRQDFGRGKRLTVGYSAAAASKTREDNRHQPPRPYREIPMREFWHAEGFAGLAPKVRWGAGIRTARDQHLATELTVGMRIAFWSACRVAWRCPVENIVLDPFWTFQGRGYGRSGPGGDRRVGVITMQPRIPISEWPNLPVRLEDGYGSAILGQKDVFVHVSTYNHRFYWVGEERPFCGQTPCFMREGDGDWHLSPRSLVPWGAQVGIAMPPVKVFQVVPVGAGRIILWPLPAIRDDSPGAGARTWDVCHGPVPGTPCDSPEGPIEATCELGDTAWGQDIGGVPGEVYQCAELMRVMCAYADATEISPAAAAALGWAVDRYRASPLACTRCGNYAVSYCANDEVDNAAVSKNLWSQGETKAPPVSWRHRRGTYLDILAKGQGFRDIRQWGDNSADSDGHLVERYLYWFRVGDHTFTADPQRSYAPTGPPHGWNFAWVRAFGPSAADCSGGYGPCH